MYCKLTYNHKYINTSLTLIEPLMMVNFLKENPLREEYPFTILVGPTFNDT